MDSQVEKSKKKKHKKSRWSKVISFDEEVVPKNLAQQILAKEGLQNLEISENETESDVKKTPKQRKKQKSKKEASDDCTEVSSTVEVNIETGEECEDDTTKQTKKKKKKKKAELHDEHEENVDDEDVKPTKKRKKVEESDKPEGSEESTSNNSKKQDSIREQKRKKHAKLIEEKKIKTELALQQKSLNYLSKWKHSRNEWKFEKLRQIWLQHNMYDSSKVPQEFWDTLLEYFGNSQGKARQIILKDALKIIEEAEKSEDGNGEKSGKIDRARETIQHLQE